MSRVTHAVEYHEPMSAANYDVSRERAPDPDVTVWKAARHTAHEAFIRYCANIHRKLYLYHQPSRDGFAGHTCIASRSPGRGWMQSMKEHLPRHYSEDKLTYWIHGFLRKLPILGD